MEHGGNIVSFVFACSLIAYSSPAPVLHTSSDTQYYGIHPQDEKYYSSDPIKCKDGSNSFARDRLNDGFCDCVDGTDEPGTSACPHGRFYCRNEGSTSQLLFSSRVNDNICDCCDGSDEYDGSFTCLNTCLRDANVSNGEYNYTTKMALGDKSLHKNNRVSLEDLIQNLKELKILVFLEVVFIMMAFRLFHRHIRYRRRWYR